MESVAEQERLKAELEGLKYMVNLYWGGNEQNMIKVVVKAKALLEANCEEKPFAGIKERVEEKIKELKRKEE